MAVVLFATGPFAADYPQERLEPRRACDQIPSRTIESPPGQIRKDTLGIDPVYRDNRRPRNPEELFACVQSGAQVVPEGWVCAREVHTIYCIRAPCPSPQERWVSYPNAHAACASPHVEEYVRERCLGDIDDPARP